MKLTRPGAIVQVRLSPQVPSVAIGTYLKLRWGHARPCSCREAELVSLETTRVGGKRRIKAEVQFPSKRPRGRK